MAQDSPMPPLLLATQQLGVGWWAQNVLPLLVAQKSAAAATLSCKQLSKLCQGGQQALQLDGDGLQETAAVARIPAHFPACRKLTVVPRSSDDLAFHLPDALDALTGMTGLSTLVLALPDAAAAADACAMGMALQGIRRLLAAVQPAQAAAPAPPAAAAAGSSQMSAAPSLALQVTLHKCGAVAREWHAHPRVWQAFGQLLGLGSLQFSAASTGVQMLPSSIAQVSALAGIASSLRTLLVEPGLDQLQADQAVDYSALGSLSSLTRLCLPLAAERQGLSSISSCCQLQRLTLEFKDASDAVALLRQQVTLQSSELAALGELMQLTRLTMDGTPSAPSEDSGWSFLSSLQQLRVLDVTACLPHTAVAVLAHLTCLTSLRCGWEQHRTGQPRAEVRCTAVRELCVLDGAPPLCVFPGLTEIIQCMAWDPAVLSSAAECCPQLNLLQMCNEFGGGLACDAGSLLASAPATARTAAVSSLAALQQFVQLSLAVNDNAEVCALAALQQVKVLYLVVPVSSSCSVQGLAVGLAAMRQLQDITSELPDSINSSLQHDDVQLLLSAVRHVDRVEYMVQQKHVEVEVVQDAVQSAIRVLTEQGLPPACAAQQVLVLAR
uniref:Uncharacterized protein n=1 Tax=Tetradesmus obliquus TaxID=3088 RepID=A0A383W4Q4_TETOB|eukprot:jgi/Sobl393_1/18391/SZX71656.1